MRDDCLQTKRESDLRSTCLRQAADCRICKTICSCKVSCSFSSSWIIRQWRRERAGKTWGCSTAVAFASLLLGRLQMLIRKGLHNRFCVLQVYTPEFLKDRRATYITMVSSLRWNPAEALHRRPRGDNCWTPGTVNILRDKLGNLCSSLAMLPSISQG